MLFGFNTQPPEGGWLYITMLLFYLLFVSTHSRPKAAGTTASEMTRQWIVSTHSRPKAAGTAKVGDVTWGFSFNTQPPEGGWKALKT